MINHNPNSTGHQYALSFAFVERVLEWDRKQIYTDKQNHSLSRNHQFHKLQMEWKDSLRVSVKIFGQSDLQEEIQKDHSGIKHVACLVSLSPSLPIDLSLSLHPFSFSHSLREGAEHINNAHTCLCSALALPLPSTFCLKAVNLETVSKEERSITALSHSPTSTRVRPSISLTTRVGTRLNRNSETYKSPRVE